MDDAELVRQLRNMNEYEPLGHDGWRAADRIEALIAERDAANSRLSRAYSERAAAAVAMARFALMCGYNAGVGKDGNIEWSDEWRVVLYVDTPNGQVSWHIAPDDQHLLHGLPKYNGVWDGTFRSRDGSYCTWDHSITNARDAALEEAAKVADVCFRQNAFSEAELYKWGIASGAQAIAAAIRAMKGKSHE